MLNGISHRLPPSRGTVNFILAQLYIGVNMVLVGIQDHTAGPAQSTSVTPIFDVAAATLPFYPFSCAVVRLRRMAHCWRILLNPLNGVKLLAAERLLILRNERHEYGHEASP